MPFAVFNDLHISPHACTQEADTSEKRKDEQESMLGDLTTAQISVG